MTDLQTLLDRSVDHHVDVHPDADLRRGRSALRRRRRTVGAGIAAALLALGGTATVLGRTSVLPLVPSHAGKATVHAGGFEIPPPPDGWSVQAADESRVVIAPDGLPKADFDDPHLNLQIMGKLLVHLQHSGLPIHSSTPVEQDGRTFYEYEGGGTAVQVGVREPAGGWLILQEAPRLHWTTQQMVDYLDGVVLLSKAAPD
jgi:hypothetical protein